MKSITASHITFIFDLDKPKRLEISKKTINDETPTKIALDSNKLWDFSKVPHALISGATGGGKTYMIY